jgi:alkanesulfonate monooxygenase SsuD/methylene tetrahydromethanopterin reductase-like flavin-dependent oxidoreductase (luciferase family)
MNPPPLFGLSIDPSSADPQEPFRRARLADEGGLDLVTLMDHPYNARLLETWTLLTALGSATEHVHLATNVLNLPLRPPAMIAKMAATLDVLTGGRLELGLGAGGVWDAIEAYGGQRRTPGEAFLAYRDALHILRGLWNSDGQRFTYEGEFYQVRNARFGPAPAHPIRIWVGAYGPRMLKLTGEVADGLLISHNHATPDRLPQLNAWIDEGARQAGRSPSEVRRGYNLMGVIHTPLSDTLNTGLGPEYIQGSPADWVERLSGFYREARQDTLIFWPVAGNQFPQIETYVREVVPALKEALSPEVM